MNTLDWRPTLKILRVKFSSNDNLDDIDSNESIAESEEINVPEIDMEKVAKVESILPFKEDQPILRISLYICSVSFPGKKFSNQLDRYFPLSTFVVAFGKKQQKTKWRKTSYG